MADQATNELMPALVEESFGCDVVNVISEDPGPLVCLRIRFGVGQAAPGLLLYAKIARIRPEVAIMLGEHLVKEGRRLKTGLVVASSAPEPPADWRRPGDAIHGG